jgi:molybdopterin-binding protein
LCDIIPRISAGHPIFDRIDPAAAAATANASAVRLMSLLMAKERRMKLSARNQLKGKIVGVTKGQTTAHVRIDIGGGVIVTSSITNEAVDDLALKVGDDAFAVIKASDVMVAK